MKQAFSDEILNAYLDDELHNDERRLILQAIPNDTELSERLCRLQKVKDMVQLAYHQDKPKPDHQLKPLDNRMPAIAATVLLSIGLLAGWFGNQYFTHQPSLSELAQSVQVKPVNSISNNDWRLMLHVNTNDPMRLNSLLDETEHLLKTSAENGKKVEIEILTNGSGLSLLKQSGNQNINRLRSLSQEYDNLALLACQRAINKLKVEKGVNLKLIPEAKVVDSAMHQVITRQKEGWSYLRI